VVLPDAASIATNVDLANIFKVQFTAAVGATRMLANPTGSPYDCQKVIWTFTQSAGGGNDLTFDTKFRTGDYIDWNITRVSIAHPSSRDYMGCMYRADTDTWDIIAWVDAYRP